MAVAYHGVSAANSSTSDNITLQLPSSMATGMLLIAFIAVRGTAQFTAPTGWTTIQASTGGNNNSTENTAISQAFIAWTIYSGTDPDLTFTRTGIGIALGRTVAFTGTDTTTPIGDMETIAPMATTGARPRHSGVTVTAEDGVLLNLAFGAYSNAMPSGGSDTIDGINPSPVNWPTTKWEHIVSQANTAGSDTSHGAWYTPADTLGATGDIAVEVTTKGSFPGKHCMTTLWIQPPVAAPPYNGDYFLFF